MSEKFSAVLSLVPPEHSKVEPAAFLLAHERWKFMQMFIVTDLEGSEGCAVASSIGSEAGTFRRSTVVCVRVCAEERKRGNKFEKGNKGLKSARARDDDE